MFLTLRVGVLGLALLVAFTARAETSHTPYTQAIPDIPEPQAQERQPLYLMVRELPVSIRGFAQYAFSADSERRELETGFERFWLMTEVTPNEILTMRVIPDLASRTVVEAVTRVHAQGSWIGFQFGKFRSAAQQMTPRPDTDLVAGGPRALTLASKFPLGAEVFVRLGSLKIFVSAIADESPASFAEQKMTDGIARFVWKAGTRFTVEEALQAGRRDDRWRIRATTRVGYKSGHARAEAFGVYQAQDASGERAWGLSLSAAYHVAEQWEISGAYDHLRLEKSVMPADEARVQMTFFALNDRLHVAAQYGYTSESVHRGLLHLQTNF